MDPRNLQSLLPCQEWLNLGNSHLLFGQPWVIKKTNSKAPVSKKLYDCLFFHEFIVYRLLFLKYLFMAASSLSCGRQDLGCSTWDPLLRLEGLSSVVARGLQSLWA